MGDILKEIFMAPDLRLVRETALENSKRYIRRAIYTSNQIYVVS